MQEHARVAGNPAPEPKVPVAEPGPADPPDGAPLVPGEPERDPTKEPPAPTKPDPGRPPPLDPTRGPQRGPPRNPNPRPSRTPGEEGRRKVP
jgi:hypothetical protein